MHLWCNLDMVDQGVPSESLDDVCGPHMSLLGSLFLLAA